MQCEWQRKKIENSLLCSQVPELICINTCSFGQCNNYLPTTRLGLPRWFSGKESACNAGNTGSILEPGRSLGGGNGNPFQYSCLGNPMDRGAWWATSPNGLKELDTTGRMSATILCFYTCKKVESVIELVIRAYLEEKVKY